MPTKKHSPEYCVSFVCVNPQRWCIFCKILLFLHVLEDFFQVPGIGDLRMWNSSFRLPKGWTSPLRRLFPVVSRAEDSSLRYCFLVLEVCASFCCLSSEYNVGWPTQTVSSCVLGHHSGPNFRNFPSCSRGSIS